ncbi:MAG: 4Fe-4S dicluster domain-containing protein [Deltaproteobacteria bacterium]|nr:4Fe-4S dicluster domain-containing protein [Deltaproteobacteria bacterium]
MIHINQERCTGCKTCVNVCPHQVLELKNKKAKIAHEARCIECGACRLNCRENAVTVEKGTGCLFVIIKEDILGFKKDACTCG